MSSIPVNKPNNAPQLVSFHILQRTNSSVVKKIFAKIVKEVGKAESGARAVELKEGNTSIRAIVKAEEGGGLSVIIEKVTGKCSALILPKKICNGTYSIVTRVTQIYQDRAAQFFMGKKILKSSSVSSPSRAFNREKAMHIFVQQRLKGFGVKHAVDSGEIFRVEGGNVVLEPVYKRSLDKEIALSKLPMKTRLEICQQQYEFLKGSLRAGVLGIDNKIDNVLVRSGGDAPETYATDFGCLAVLPEVEGGDVDFLQEDFLTQLNKLNKLRGVEVFREVMISASTFCSSIAGDANRAIIQLLRFLQRAQGYSPCQISEYRALQGKMKKVMVFQYAYMTLEILLGSQQTKGFFSAKYGVGVRLKDAPRLTTRLRSKLENSIPDEGNRDGFIAAIVIGLSENPSDRPLIEDFLEKVTGL